jgi:hypothetical protein
MAVAPTRTNWTTPTQPCAGHAGSVSMRLACFHRVSGDRDHPTRIDLQREAQIKAVLSEADAGIPFLGQEIGESRQ